MINITEVRMELASNMERCVRAYCSFVIDGTFVVNECKVISDGRGGVFVSMPGRPKKTKCLECRANCSLTDKYCHHCGAQLPIGQFVDRPYLDVCHPISEECRQVIQRRILDDYFALVEEKHESANGRTH